MSASSNNPAITNQLPLTVDLPDMEDKDLYSDKLEGLLKDISDTVNLKEGGLYTLDENFSSMQYFTPEDPQSFRNVYRKVFDFVTLANSDIAPGDTVSFQHEIDNITGSAHIYANCATNDGRYFTVVYPDVFMDDESVTFTNPDTETLNQCYVVCNYLKN